jgi:hypothetical protein
VGTRSVPDPVPSTLRRACARSPAGAPAPASSAVALLVVADGSRGRHADYVSWPGNVPPAVDDRDGPCSHRFSFEFVRSNASAGGLTLTIVRGPVKSKVRSGSERIYRPIRPLRRIRWGLRCASRSSRTSGHWRASSSRACGSKGTPSPSATTAREEISGAERANTRSCCSTWSARQDRARLAWNDPRRCRNRPVIVLTVRAAVEQKGVSTVARTTR